MRKFVAIPGGTLKRITNRLDGCYSRRNHEAERDEQRELSADSHGRVARQFREAPDAHKQRRQTRQELRQLVGAVAF